jgi:hypothetical protein
MPSFSSLITTLTGAGFFYEKSPRHATYNFNQDGKSLYTNQPRFPFEFYININLANVGTAKDYISTVFNTASWSQVTPLVKSIEMPSMKIETTALNQYNRKRLSQTKIEFNPIKMVFHDVADGKTLKFWEMYYRYYFADGNEAGNNEAILPPGKKKPMTVEQLIKNITPSINPNITSLATSVKNLINGTQPAAKPTPTNTLGQKSAIQNIVTDTLDNHNFGFNLDRVKDIRNLIQSIDIFQVHGGRFNKVTLVNPRIASFNHDTLNYASSDKTVEITMSIEYEYAYYEIQNMKLGSTTTDNGSSTEPFEHGEFLELPSLAFNATLMDFVESNNPLLQSDNPILQRVGKNVQSSIGKVTGSFLSDKVVRPVSASVLNGMANISPKPATSPAPPAVQSRSFGSTAVQSSTQYKDINRVGKSSV